jgi:RNA-directed DNA polymerase
MTYSRYELLFRQKATNAGYSEDKIQKCLAYAKPLLERDLPIIYNTTNLCALIGYNKEYIKGVAADPKFFYRSFKIKKKNGKLRLITEPLPSLKEIQLWILENILYHIKVSRYAKAYVKKKTIHENVKYHTQKEKVLSLDLKDFFSSIKREEVEKIFKSLGYSSNVSNLLSKLCCLHEVLPQGAPTSPCLSNIVMRHFDSKVSVYCNGINVKFTRYADDLTFSGSFDEIQITNFIREQLKELDLTLNEEKISIMNNNQRQIVTGIIVNEKLQIAKTDRKKLRLEMYYIEKYGLDSHLVKTKNTKINYLKHIAGKINYALFINPHDDELRRYSTFLKTYRD